MIVENNYASVLRNYDYQFYNLIDIDGVVAEIRKAKDGKLISLTIFFDTLSLSFLRKNKIKFVSYF